MLTSLFPISYRVCPHGQLSMTEPSPPISFDLPPPSLFYSALSSEKRTATHFHTIAWIFTQYVQCQDPLLVPQVIASAFQWKVAVIAWRLHQKYLGCSA